MSALNPNHVFTISYNDVGYKKLHADMKAQRRLTQIPENEWSFAFARHDNQSMLFFTCKNEGTSGGHSNLIQFGKEHFNFVKEGETVHLHIPEGGMIKMTREDFIKLLD